MFLIVLFFFHVTQQSRMVAAKAAPAAPGSANLCAVVGRACPSFNAGIVNCECDSKVYNIDCSWNATANNYKGECAQTFRPLNPISYMGKDGTNFHSR